MATIPTRPDARLGALRTPGDPDRFDLDQVMARRRPKLAHLLDVTLDVPEVPLTDTFVLISLLDDDDPAPFCPCAPVALGTDQSDHDFLIECGHNGADGLLDLLDHFTEWDWAGRGDSVYPQDFRQFVAAHNWPDPVAMVRLAQHIEWASSMDHKAYMAYMADVRPERER